MLFNSFGRMENYDFMDFLAAIIVQSMMNRINEKDQKCDYLKYCQPYNTDCADLIHSLLKTNGLNRLRPSPIQPPSNTVTIFAGPYAGHFGVICQGQFNRCSCCVSVKTTSGAVKVSRKHCNIHH